MSPEEEVIRAGQARQVLDSAIFKEVKENILAGIHAQMAKVPLAEEKMHTRLIITLQLWNSIESYLDNVVMTGEMAKFQVEREQRAEEARKFPWFR